VSDLIFFTTPPEGIYYPYLLANYRNVEKLIARKFELMLVDSGVFYWFFKRRMEDYPAWYLDEAMRIAFKLSRIYGDKVWFTIPDYPSDYYPTDWRRNVERTFANIERFRRMEGVEWVYVIQGPYPFNPDDRISCLEAFEDSCKRMKKYAPKRLGIGTICKGNDLKFIVECCKIAREYFPDEWIHAFGPSLKSIPLIRPYINSFDSMAYIFYAPWQNSKWRNPKVGERLPSSSEKRARFHAWMKSLKKKLSQKTLEEATGVPVLNIWAPALNTGVPDE